MKGTGAQIATGLEACRKKCGDTIRTIKLQVTDEPSTSMILRLVNAITPSARELRKLWISHQGGLGEMIVMITERCRRVETLVSEKLGQEGILIMPTLSSSELSLLKSLKLNTLVWTCGGFNLRCDDDLMDSLRDARVVKIGSNVINSSWKLRFLSRTSSLTSLSLRSDTGEGDEGVDMFPTTLNLPNLESLNLTPAIKSTTGSTEGFVKALEAPKPEMLTISELRIQDFSTMKTGLTLRTLMVIFLPDYVPAPSAKIGATTFVQAITEWKMLSSLFLVTSNLGVDFLSELLRLLTLLSREGFRAGYTEEVPLPKLHRTIFLGHPRVSEVDGIDLLSLIAARKAASLGLSKGQVVAASFGDLEAFEKSEESNKKPAFAPSRSCLKIISVRTKASGKLDEKSLALLERTLFAGNSIEWV